MSIKEIQEKSQAIISANNSKIITAYLLENLEREPCENDINRTCGAPIGVDEENWPTIDGEKMDHAITVDLDSVPDMKPLFPETTKAFALFVSSLEINDAFEPNTSETALVLLNESDIAKGLGKLEKSEENEYESTTFIPHKVELPEEVFSEDIYGFDDENPLYQLYGLVERFAMVGGKPLWLQGAEYDGEILLQFNDDFVDMNMGDSGVMYVFKDTAFWQCL